MHTHATGSISHLLLVAANCTTNRGTATECLSSCVRTKLKPATLHDDIGQLFIGRFIDCGETFTLDSWISLILSRYIERWCMEQKKNRLKSNNFCENAHQLMSISWSISRFTISLWIILHIGVYRKLYVVRFFVYEMEVFGTCGCAFVGAGRKWLVIFLFAFVIAIGKFWLKFITV